ncbi:hypothetical protein [Desulfomarina profundi]|nr:hypothetical protein [Desulfomarina profundi]
MIRDCYQALFAFYLDCLKNNPENLPPGVDLMADLDFIYPDQLKHEKKICDFIAGMTDDYFITQARLIGCTVPDSL